jgi:hypothetical protein
MQDDFGHFGKGLDGYAHYMEEADGSGKGGGGRGPGSFGGYLTCLLLFLLATAGVLRLLF